MVELNKFIELRRVIEELGVSVSEKTLRHVKALAEGILITDENPVLETEDGFYDIAPNGDLYRVAIFINQRNATNHPQRETAAHWHKYHLYRCTTIENYPISRQHRYKKTNNREGLFQYIITHNNREYEVEARQRGRRLNLCKHCFRELPLAFRRYRVSEFPLESFYQAEPTDQFLDYSEYEYDHDQIPRLYAHNWRQIANGLKALRGWCCEQCYIDLSRHKKYLHAHHTDGDVNNNIIANLKALCIYCHAEQPLHDHIKRQDAYQEFVSLFGPRNNNLL